jgi:hypothetical protein
MLPRGVTRTGALARPEKAPFPSQGKTCGRREREADARSGGGSDPFDPSRSRRWKAPGPRKGIVLRGTVLERGARSVRLSAEVSSSAGGSTDDNRCSSGAEEGNVVGSRAKMRGHPTRGHAMHSRQGDASFTRSEGPCTSIVAQPAAGNRHGVTRSLEASRSGKPGQPGTTGTGASENGRSAARRVSPLLARGARVMRQKRKAVSGRRPYEARESGSKCPHVVAVAEVGRRRLLAPNKLVRSAPKRVAARVNGGLARGHRRR